MADLVTFAGLTLLAEGEGVFSEHVPGLVSPSWEFVRLARSLGEIAKHVGAQGADHQFKITYLRVAKGGVGARFSALQELVSPGVGSPLSGTLVVPDYPSVPHCVCVSVTPGAQKLSGLVTGTSGDYVACYDLEFGFVFRQLRR